jgi:DNA topoisomerase IB
VSSRASARLKRSDCSDSGIQRRGRGRGFAYQDAGGERIEDEETLARIRELAIPPAWREVWICPDPLGHIQATGLDAAGRKQYLYHERWQLRAAARKFESMREFAASLPRLRRAVKADLGRDGMPRERALASAGCSRFVTHRSSGRSKRCGGGAAGPTTCSSSARKGAGATSAQRTSTPTCGRRSAREKRRAKIEREVLALID